MGLEHRADPSVEDFPTGCSGRFAGDKPAAKESF